MDQPTASGLTVIKAISLWEPWASLMATGAKTIETRSWSTSYRGPLLICASKKRISGLSDILLHEPQYSRGLGFRGVGHVIVADVIRSLNFGMAVAVVDLVSIVPTSDMGLNAEQVFGDYTPGRFAWLTRNRRRLAPFPIPGHQGLWNEAVATERLRPCASS